MRCPVGLFAQERVHHLAENPLHPRGFERADRLDRRVAVERGIADHDAHGVAVLGYDVLDDRIEGSAGLASRIEELHDGHGRVLWPECGRIRPHQCLGLLGRHGRRDSGVVKRCVTRGIPRSTTETGGAHGEDGKDKGAAVHGVVSLSDRAESSAMRAKAASDRAGMGSPKMTWFSSVQDGPVAVQGWIGSGISPA